jgi:DNA-binding MarR family transcriptional regulator
VTRLVDRLEKAGLVRREACSEDRRGLNAVITMAGRTALRKAWPEYARVIRERFLADLGDAEVRAVTSALEKLQRGAREVPAVVPRASAKGGS